MSRVKELLRRYGTAGWLRWALTITILVVAAVLTVRHWSVVTQGFETLRAADWRWIVFGLVGVALSFLSMAAVMRRLLHAAGVTTANRRNTNALVLASNAWSASVPGGAAFAAALQIKRMVQWGASAVVVSWVLLFSGALSFLGMAFLGLSSLFFIGRGGTPAVLVTIAIIVLLATALLWQVTKKPELLTSAAHWGLGVVNKIRQRPADTGHEQVAKVIAQLTEVRLGVGSLSISFFWSFMNWVTEIVALYAAVRAVGVDDISATKILLVFVTGKLAGFIQATPGGVGTVEALLTGALIASGTTGAEAFAAVAVYRIISFALPTIVGWIIYLLRFDRATAQVD